MKKILSIFLAGMVVFSAVNAFAVGLPNRYPQHVAMTSISNVEGLVVPGPSPAENVFYVIDGDNRAKSFVLLDCDKEGNYFVMTEEEYGTHSFTALTGETINKSNVTDSQWEYNPENPNSVAYWLNNSKDGFLKNGNGGNKLPSAIVDNIIEHEWQVENNYTDKNGLKKDQVTDVLYNEAIEWANAKSGIRTVTSKLALISATEYVAYSDKIGATKVRSTNGWAGFMTRTVNSRVTSDAEGKVTYANNFYHICGSNGTQSKVRLSFDGNMAQWCQNAYSVRPVFWLDKDFFKKEKIYIALTGENVIHEVKKGGLTDLSELYSDNELMLMDFDISKLPSADNMIVVGPKAKGALNEVIYHYTSPLKEAEGNSVFEKYISESANGNFVKTPVLEKIIFGDEHYAKIALIPYSINNLSGKRNWSQVFKLREPLPVMVKSCEIMNGSGDGVKTLYSMPEIKTEITIKNYSNKKENVMASFVLFDKNNAVQLMNSKDLELAAQEEDVIPLNLLNVDVEEGYTLTVMVQYGENKPVYYKRIK